MPEPVEDTGNRERDHLLLLRRPRAVIRKGLKSRLHPCRKIVPEKAKPREVDQGHRLHDSRMLSEASGDSDELVFGSARRA